MQLGYFIQYTQKVIGFASVSFFPSNFSNRFFVGFLYTYFLSLFFFLAYDRAGSHGSIGKDKRDCLVR